MRCVRGVSPLLCSGAWWVPAQDQGAKPSSSADPRCLLGGQWHKGGMLQVMVGSGGYRGQQFQKSRSNSFLVDPCQQAKCAEHTGVPQGFIKEPNSLGFTGISSVLLQSGSKELMLLRGRGVDSNTFTLLCQRAEPCELPLAVSEFRLLGFPSSLCAASQQSSWQLRLRFVHFSFTAYVSNKGRKIASETMNSVSEMLHLLQSQTQAALSS